MMTMTQPPMMPDMPGLNGFQADLINEVLTGQHRVIFLPGGRYGGKTWGMLLAQILHGQRYRNPRLLLGGTSLTDIRANCYEGLDHWADMLDLHFKWSPNAPEFRVDDQTWEVRGLKDVVGETRVRGRSYKGGIVDELSDTLQDNWAMLFTSVRGPGVKLIAAFNPKGPRHWTQEMVKRPEGWDAVVFHSTMDDNLFADADSVAAFRNASLPDYQRQRLILGLPATPDGLVYPHWDDVEDYYPGQPCAAGVDYGESAVTTAIYFQRRDIDYRKWATTSEYYWDGQRQGRRSAAEHAEAIKRGAPGQLTALYVDPSAVDLIYALQRAGLPVHWAVNHAIGYDLTNGALQGGQLAINSRRCPGLTTEIEDLVYNPLTGKPDLHCVDHATDALRYGWMGVTDQVGARVANG